MKLYHPSDPSRSGYRKKFHYVWNIARLFAIASSVQRLADQARLRSIWNNNQLSDIKLLEIQGIVSVDIVDVTFNDWKIETQDTVRTDLTLSPSDHLPETKQTPLVSQRTRDIRHSCVSPRPDSPTPTSPTSDTDEEAITEQLQKLQESPSEIAVKPLRHVIVNRKWHKKKHPLLTHV